MKNFFPILLTLLILNTGCGGSGNSSSEQAESVGVSTEEEGGSGDSSSEQTESGGLSAGEQAIADQIAAELTSDSDFPFSGDATCIAETTVSKVGLDRYVEIEMVEDSTTASFEDQPAEVQEIFMNSVLDCIGTSGLATLLVESSAEDGDDLPLRIEDAECLAEGLDREQWLEFLESSFSESHISSEGEGAFFTEILKECPQILVNMFQDDLGLDQAQAECLADAFSDTLIDAFASGELEGDPSSEVFEEMLLAFIGCGVDMSQLE